MSKMHSAKKLVIDFILVMLGNAIMALGTAGFEIGRASCRERV